MPYLPSSYYDEILLTSLHDLHWKDELKQQSKMSFHSKIKFDFGEEPYLKLQNRAYWQNIAKNAVLSRHRIMPRSLEVT